MVQNSLYFLLMSMLLLISCNSNKVDESEIQALPIELNLKRFEKDLFSNSSNNSIIDLPLLRTRYGNFFELYTHQILSIPVEDDSLVASNLQKFVTDSEIQQVYDDVDSTLRIWNQLKRSSLHF